MPEFFIGTDILSVLRISKILNSHHKNQFKTHTFTKSEIDYCEGKANPSIHYAGRFAAKEAIKKALLSSGIISDIPWCSIEVLPEKQGAPKVYFHTDQPLLQKCKVSISHTDEFAVAFALLEVS